MENKINIAELLKDCPKGMKLDCAMWENTTLHHVDIYNCYPIFIEIGGGELERFTEYGQWHSSDYAKCVIFPKGKTTWEGFQRPFKDGDVIFTHANCLKVGLCNTWISIYQENRDGRVMTYVNYDVDYAVNGDNYYGDVDGGFLCMENDIIHQRYATEEEKQKLFQAIKANGYKWNAETKTLEKLVEPKFKVGAMIQDVDKYKVRITEVNLEDECYGYESMIAKGIGAIPFKEQNNWELVPNKFDINTLIPFESRVLIRCSMDGIWKPAVFGFRNGYNNNAFYIVGGSCWNQCIPYLNNEHLCGTTNDCDEFYKTW